VHVYLTIRNRYLFDNSCPVRGEVCVSIILLGTVMTPGLIYISYREIKSMGWKSFLSLGESDFQLNWFFLSISSCLIRRKHAC